MTDGNKWSFEHDGEYPGDEDESRPVTWLSSPGWEGIKENIKWCYSCSEEHGFCNHHLGMVRGYDAAERDYLRTLRDHGVLTEGFDLPDSSQK